jgi:hypothetical protein
MSLKKILILPVGFILIHVLYIGCCKCAEGVFYREISSTTASHYSTLPNTSIDTTYTNDSLTTIIQFRFNYITQIRTNFANALVNTAYATSCSCDNFTDLGYKYKMDSLVITSNNEFNGVPAGDNLAAFFKGVNKCNRSNVTSLVYVPIPQMLDSLNTCRAYDGLYINTATQPGLNKIHKFKYSLFSNGNIYDINGRKVVKWQ